MTFKEQCEKHSQNPFIEKISKYLLTREDMTEKLENPEKSLTKMMNYIELEMRKKVIKKSGAVCIPATAEEIYNLAIHYYDESNENLNINEEVLNKITVSKNVNPINEIKEKPKKHKKAKKQVYEEFNLFD